MAEKSKINNQLKKQNGDFSAECLAPLPQPVHFGDLAGATQRSAQAEEPHHFAQAPVRQIDGGLGFLARSVGFTGEKNRVFFFEVKKNPTDFGEVLKKSFLMTRKFGDDNVLIKIWVL